MLAAAVVLDQATKWWGWRHVPRAIINDGSSWFIGRSVSDWFSGPVSGPLLDVVNCVLLSLAGYLQVRRRRRVRVLVVGALMIAGWSSDLLDRLGLHTLTAPGSVRGAVESAVPVPVGGSVGLRAQLTNNSPRPDRLVAVTTPVTASVELLGSDGAVATGGIEVPGGGRVDARTGPVLIRLTGLTAGLHPEALVPITFEFANAGSVTLDDVPVATPSR